MTIKFTGGSEALREFTTEKLARVTKLATNITNIHIIFKVDKQRHIAEANIHVPNSQPIHAEAESPVDIYEAINPLVDKLIRQLSRLKEKNADHD